MICPRCLGSGEQKSTKNRAGVGSIGGTKLENLESGKCEFCGGVGEINIALQLPDNPDQQITWK